MKKIIGDVIVIGMVVGIYFGLARWFYKNNS